MEEWKSKQNLLGGDPDEVDPDIALYTLLLVFLCLFVF